MENNSNANNNGNDNNNNNEYNQNQLERFVAAQDPVWKRVVRELANGKKVSHWMWFVFPQLASLGVSDMAQYYGLKDLSEAKHYYQHAVLGPRLDHCVGLLLRLPSRLPRWHRQTNDSNDHHDQSSSTTTTTTTTTVVTVDNVFGEVDAKKLRSCITLFACLPKAPPTFQQVLDQYFRGNGCRKTLNEIRKSSQTKRRLWN
jgi:uncharacterized protein (DUF1810 family)